LNDALMALRLQEEEDKKRPATGDAHIARKIADDEQRRIKETLDREKADTDLARRIAAEEQQQEAKRLAETKAREEARRKQEAEKKKKLADDEALAKRIADEEQRALTVRKDYELARKLDEQEKKVASPPPSFVYPSVYNSPSAYPTFNRDHVINIHNRYCYCGNVQSYNNNHLHAIHTTHCNCGYSLHAVQNPASNHGRKHVHDYRCCAINHLHAAQCYCAYRSHQHGFNCCSLNHTHDEYCHCVAK